MPLTDLGDLVPLPNDLLLGARYAGRVLHVVAPLSLTRRLRVALQKKRSDDAGTPQRAIER